MVNRVLYLFLLIFISCGVYAKTESLQSPNVNIKTANVNLTQFPMGYFIDTSLEMPFEQIQQQQFTPSKSEVTLGPNAKITWSKIIINNESPQQLRLFLHNSDAYHLQDIDFYETKNGELLKQINIQLDKPGPHPNIFGGSAIFSFHLAAGENKTIFVRSVTFSHQWYALALFDEEYSKRALVGSSSYIALLVGMMLALMLYNFFLYLSARKIENIVYAFYLISGIIWVSLSYGLGANFFGIFSADLLQFNSTLYSMPSFLILFMMLIFETKKRYPKEHIALCIILTILVAEFFYSLFDLVSALKPASSLAALMMTVTLGVSISLWRKRDPLAKYFFLGHAMFIIFNMLAVLYYKGITESNQINSHGVGIGIVLEALMMAFILSYRIRTLEKIKSAQSELKRLADTDPLTKLYNRRYFDKACSQLLAKSKTAKKELSIIIADLDFFKGINDTYGHDIGDRVIIEFANILTKQQKVDDIACRFGGEEFILLLNCDADNAKIIAQRIRSTAEKCIVKTENNQEVRFTVSIGINQVSQTANNIKESISLADQALYKAKKQGRNCVVVIKE
ncbi:GGDEF domain-containing protein [Pseudoalteromonas neustonica]|uniref:diguanylate cyclase n=1 Tax=Pseudoalteromonas neustonica TaxID=1840331 RepID=A0ABY3F9G5_9GAMM|nr:diguanylate cyclase [Pseudoalteromonas neustonica]TVU80398.1 GGDEF domain-containing protein [Pseudoalteromonas neustonica]